MKSLLAAAFIIIGELFSGLDLLAQEDLSDMPLAVVTVSDSILRSGPGASNAELQKLASGTLLYVDARENEWLKVVTTEGKHGWLESSRVKFANDARNLEGEVEEQGSSVIPPGSKAHRFNGSTYYFVPLSGGFADVTQ